MTTLAFWLLFLPVLTTLWLIWRFLGWTFDWIERRSVGRVERL